MGKHSTACIVGDNVTVIKGEFKGCKGVVTRIRGVVKERYVLEWENGGISPSFTADYLTKDKRN